MAKGKAKPFKSVEVEGAKKRVVLIDYDSIFTPGIEDTVRAYNRTHPEDTYSIDMYKASTLDSLANTGYSDMEIHTGGLGEPVKGNSQGKPKKLYICHSHQKKTEQEGGTVEHLSEYQKGVGYMEVKEDDPVIGKKGDIVPIDKYHVLAVTKPPKNAKVIATSKQILEDGREVETAEAIRHPDDSISLQGHPGGGTAAHIIHNLLGESKNGKYSNHYKKPAYH